MSPFLWQCQNLCLLSLAFFIDWWVVAPNEFSLTTLSSLMSVKFSVQRFLHWYRLVMAVQMIPHNLIWVSSWHLFAVVQGLSSLILIYTIKVTWCSNNRLLGILGIVSKSPSSWRGPKPLWLTQLSNLWWIPNSVCIGFCIAMKMDSSRRFQRYPSTYMCVSSRLPYTVD